MPIAKLQEIQKYVKIFKAYLKIQNCGLVFFTHKTAFNREKERASIGGATSAQYFMIYL
jgi:hypothetical protein